MTCPQVGSSKIGDDVLVGDTRQFLLQRGMHTLQSGRMLDRWPLAAEATGPGHGPSASGCGAQIDLVGLEAAGAAVDDDPNGVTWSEHIHTGVVENDQVPLEFCLFCFGIALSGHWTRMVVGGHETLRRCQAFSENHEAFFVVVFRGGVDVLLGDV